MEKIVNIWAPTYEVADSYGRLQAELSGGLRARGVHVNAFGADAPSGVIRPAFTHIKLGYPSNEYPAISNVGPTLWVTMFESTILPAGWVENLNKSVGVIVPSQWCAETFRQNGVTVPIHVVPLGVSEVFKPVRRRQRDPFTFLAIADRSWRKNWHVVVSAFVRAFKDDPKYQLILKTRSQNLASNLIQSNVKVLTRSYTDVQMARLYGRAHVMPFPSNEGFGWPCREFAATGGVTLGMDYGGTADHLSEWGYTIPHTMEKAWKADPLHGEEELGEWGKPDFRALADLMRFVADNYEEASLRGQAAAYAIRRLYSWETFSDRVYQICEESLYASHATANR